MINPKKSSKIEKSRKRISAYGLIGCLGPIRKSKRQWSKRSACKGNSKSCCNQHEVELVAVSRRPQTVSSMNLHNRHEHRDDDQCRPNPYPQSKTEQQTACYLDRPAITAIATPGFMPIESSQPPVPFTP